MQLVTVSDFHKLFYPLSRHSPLRFASTRAMAKSVLSNYVIDELPSHVAMSIVGSTRKNEKPTSIESGTCAFFGRAGPNEHVVQQKNAAGDWLVQRRKGKRRRGPRAQNEKVYEIVTVSV